MKIEGDVQYVFTSRKDFLEFMSKTRFTYCEDKKPVWWNGTNMDALIEMLASVREMLGDIHSMRQDWHDRFQYEFAALEAVNTAHVERRKKYLAAAEEERNTA